MFQILAYTNYNPELIFMISGQDWNIKHIICDSASAKIIKLDVISVQSQYYEGPARYIVVQTLMILHKHSLNLPKFAFIFRTLS